MRRWVGTGLLLALGGVAHADDMLGHLNDWSNDVGIRIRSLTFDTIDLHFDLKNERARVRVSLPLVRLDGDVEWVDGAARVHARLDLQIAGHDLNLALPTFEIVPQSDDLYGRVIEVRVPLISGRF